MPEEILSSLPTPSTPAHGHEGLLLDILEQLKDLSLKVAAGDMVRAQLLKTISEVETNTKEIPLMMFRVQQLEKMNERTLAQIAENTEFRIRMETSQASRRMMLGGIGGIFGGIGGALVAWVLSHYGTK